MSKTLWHTWTLFISWWISSENEIDMMLLKNYYENKYK